MKKVFLLLLATVGIALSGQAQEISENAIGIRLGGGNGYGVEATYQHHLQENHRLEFDLGIRSDSHYNSFKLDGIYQWVFNIDGGFNWYVGPGIGLGHFNTRHIHNHDNYSKTFFFIAGDIGVEYVFPDIPLQLFVDFRPEIALGSYDYYDTFGPDFGLGIRFQF